MKTTSLRSVFWGLIFAATTISAAAGAGRRVIIIDVDGLRREAFYFAVNQGVLPNFERILGGRNFERALRFDKATTVFPSVTLTGQASLFTGAYPAKHGIVGNQWFNRAKDQFTDYMSVFGAHCVYGIELAGLGTEVFRNGECEGGLANRNLQSPTLYEAAAKAGKSSFVIFNQYTRQASRVARPSLGELALFGFSEVPVEPDPANFRAYDALMMYHALDAVWESGFPDILTLYFSGLDATGHKLGVGTGVDAQVVYLHEEIDFWISFLLWELERADPRWLDNTLFVITADHGQTNVGTSARIGEKLASVASADVRTADNGGMVHLYVKRAHSGWPEPPRMEEDIRPAAENLTRSEEAKEFTWKILVRDPEQGYLVYTGGDAPYRALSKDDDLKEKKELIQGLNSPRSGDILVLLKPGTYTRETTGWLFGLAGWGEAANHGSIFESDLAVPLILAGGGVKPGVSTQPASTVNIARTIADYLGFSMPEAAERLPGLSAEPIITTVAGNGTAASSGDGGPATSASLNTPAGLAIAANGDLYISEMWGWKVRRVDARGVISTVAGNGMRGFAGDGGPATAASLGEPYDLAVDAAGNVFVLDIGNQRVRRVDRQGVITTVAGDGRVSFGGDGGPATRASLYEPKGVAVDEAGNLYIADTFHHRIRKVDRAGIITTVAGNGVSGFSGDGGPATQASLNFPYDIAPDSSGNLYIADNGNYRIRKVSAKGIISTVAGNGQGGFSGDFGPATEAALYSAGGVAADGSGNLYIADLGNYRIRKVSANGIISTVAGNGVAGFSGDGSAATQASLRGPIHVALDAAGNLYIADAGNHRIRRVQMAPAPGFPAGLSMAGDAQGASGGR